MYISIYAKRIFEYVPKSLLNVHLSYERRYVEIISINSDCELLDRFVIRQSTKLISHFLNGLELESRY